MSFWFFRLASASLLLAFGALPAAAQAALSTTLPLPEVLARARVNASLQVQIRLQLHRAKTKKEDVWCRAAVLDQRWINLSGQQVGPYVCPIGDRVLHLTGTYSYADARGGKLSPLDAELQAKAAKVSESRFKWRWQKVEKARK